MAQRCRTADAAESLPLRKSAVIIGNILGSSLAYIESSAIIARITDRNSYEQTAVPSRI